MAASDDTRYYLTTFCNHRHRIADGKPVGHECYVLPTEALVAERDGDYARANLVLAKWKKRRSHRGLRDKEDAA